jgi:uncharacterized damage-inducible protein DinB
MASITELLSAEFDRELAGTRRALERVPEGRNDWKPHEKSMQLGYLAGLVATMPAWVQSIVEEEQIDLAAPGRYRTGAYDTTQQLLGAFDRAAAAGRDALARVSDDHLLKTNWRLMMGEQVLLDQPRYQALRDSALNHLYHHRGQLTVYLRLVEQAVPSLYGPSADEAYPGA